MFGKRSGAVYTEKASRLRELTLGTIHPRFKADGGLQCRLRKCYSESSPGQKKFLYKNGGIKPCLFKNMLIFHLRYKIYALIDIYVYIYYHYTCGVIYVSKTDIDYRTIGS